ncbi:MAG: diguanylate cyclase domain-containing protein [Velocimicrobium sp.]
MEKKFKIKINILIVATILTGFLCICVMSSVTYNRIIRDDIKNISKLTSTNIYSDINNELTKPIFVSLTMANDSFLKTWLRDEETMVDSKKHEQKLLDYLNGIREKYNYESVFLVSNKTNNYYYYNGINKVISNQNEHDQWYYDFLNTKKLYDLEIDTDEANENRWSIFINCRIEDEDGNLLGVTGVGLELNQVQELLESFGKDFDLEAMLFDKEGNVLIDSDYEWKKRNVFDIPVLKENKQVLLNNYYTLDVYNYKDKESSGYVITRYIDDLDWYLLIKKDTTILVDTLEEQILKEFFIIIPVILCVLWIVLRLMKRNDSKLMKLAKIDPLTDMLNRRGFNEALEYMLTNSQRSFYVFVLDIDHFKTINDSYGHLIGDKIIKLVGSIVQEHLSKHGILARWGGDEFTGYIYGEEEEVIRIVDAIFAAMNQDVKLKEYQLTSSLGLTSFQKIDTVDTILCRADQALYEAKMQGRNRYVIK